MSTKYVYFFGSGRAEGSSLMRNLLGGKGCELAEMTNLGIPVPPGFTITTQAWVHYNRAGRQWPDGLWEQALEHLKKLEEVAGAGLGDRERPLLVSVRSGARTSMPGMMDTILNLGLNDETVEGLAARSGDPRFAYDSYRRFIQMYSDVVLGVEIGVFEDILETHKNLNNLTSDTELTAEDWQEIVARYKEAVEREIGQPFPQDLKIQLWGAIKA